ncbi:MAG TPA: DUF3810 family protein [Vicinamibacterales bacterium]|nr:DUF3810 family protein [Vicinamibacterales bacterium]
MLLILRVGVVVIAVIAAIAPLPASWVERLYSGLAYPAWQRVATGASNAVPFALFDVLLLLVAVRVGVLLVRIVRPGARRGMRGVLAGVLALVALAAVLYLAFLLSWGLNYRRVGLASRLDHDAGRVTAEAAVALAREMVSGANRLHDEAHRDPASWETVSARLAPAFAGVQQQLDGRSPARPATPKWSPLTFYFERAGVDGMTNPFFLEVLVNQQLLPFERPAVLAHEWAHLAGYADESEANFVGWLICLQGPPAARYSAHLAILWDLLGALPPDERARAARELRAGPRADLQAVARRIAGTTPVLREVSWRVYDRYLKANRVEAGVRSYGTALQLMLGTRIEPGWKPALRRDTRAPLGRGDGTT